MASHEKPKLTLWERIGLVFGVVKLLSATFVRILQTLFSRLRAGWPLHRILATALLRNLDATGHSLRQHRALAPTTGWVVRRFARAKSLPLRSVEISCGGSVPPCTLHEITLNPGAPATTPERAFLYIHGGGYHHAMAPALIYMAHEYAAAGRATKFYALEYALAPELKYPGQLIQSVEAVRHLLQVEGCTASQLMVSGDSAGGNALLGVIAHIKEPSPYVAPLDLLGQDFHTTILFSPWVTMPVDSQSYKDNADWDFITAWKMLDLVAKWQPKAEVWGDMLHARQGFWSSLPSSKTIIIAGELEVFRDDILKLAGLMGATAGPQAAAKVVVLKDPNGTHDAAAPDLQFWRPMRGAYKDAIDLVKASA